MRLAVSRTAAPLTIAMTVAPRPTIRSYPDEGTWVTCWKYTENTKQPARPEQRHQREQQVADEGRRLSTLGTPTLHRVDSHPRIASSSFADRGVRPDPRTSRWGRRCDDEHVDDRADLDRGEGAACRQVGGADFIAKMLR